MTIILNKNSSFGANVLLYRIFSLTTLETMAQICNISPSDLQKIELGEKLDIEEEIMIALAKALDVSIKDLLEE